jgi:hypothetical protein
VTLLQKRQWTREEADSILSIIPHSLQNIAEVLNGTMFYTN